MELIDLTPENISEYGLLCVKNPKHDGYKAKNKWILERFKEGLKMKLAVEGEKPTALIEYMPGEKCWRAVDAPGYMVIHCIYVYGKKNLGHGLGSELVNAAIEDSKKANMNGVVMVTNEGPWLAGKGLFEKNGFKETDTAGDFSLMVLKFKDAPDPKFKGDFENKASRYRGWNLLYAAQCPYNDSSIETLKKTAESFGADLKTIELKTCKEAQEAPTPYGVFALIHDGKVLEYHYISKTRFENILKKELK
jgi:L-amino acid N-acyltransferase YncA